MLFSTYFYGLIPQSLGRISLWRQGAAIRLHHNTWARRWGGKNCTGKHKLDVFWNSRLGFAIQVTLLTGHNPHQGWEWQHAWSLCTAGSYNWHKLSTLQKVRPKGAGCPSSAHVNAHWCLKLTAGWLKQGCKWPQRRRMSMAEGAGGIPRVKSQTSTSLAAVSNIKHPSRGKKRKTKFKNCIGIMILHSRFQSIIFPVVLSTFSLSLWRRISQKPQKCFFFFSINLCFKQESSPPWVKKLSATLSLAVTQGIRSIFLPQTMLGLLIGFSSHCNSLYHLFPFFSWMTHPFITKHCHWDTNQAYEHQPQQPLHHAPENSKPGSSCEMRFQATTFPFTDGIQCLELLQSVVLAGF